MSCDGVILGKIFHSDRMTCQLRWYPPFYQQSRHRHSDAQVSILLSGKFRESARRQESCVERCSIGAKPQGAEHSVDFGPDGALILSFDLNDMPDDNDDQPPFVDGTWAWRKSSLINHLVTELSLYLSGPDVRSPDDLEGTFWDVISLWDLHLATERRNTNSPPRWLLHLKKELDEIPERFSVSAAARAVGCHRTHVARMFSRYFGVSISAYRRRTMAGAAVKYLADGATPSTASCNAGFADQSHMTRVVKTETGFTPGVIRRLLLHSTTAA